VPDIVEDDAAWDAAVSLPKHRAALKCRQLRRWLHLLAHTQVINNTVNLPLDLQGDPVFEACALGAQASLGMNGMGLTFSERELDAAEADAKAEGEAKGKAEGEAKGKAEGEAKGKADMLRRAGVTSAASFRAKMGYDPDASEQAAIALIVSPAQTTPIVPI
jgi:hypothetical protein